MGIQLPSALFPSKADVQRNREVVTKYIAEAEPISVVQVIVDGLARSNAIVTADLGRQTVDRDAALSRARGGQTRGGPLRLSSISGRFILLRGSFRHDVAASFDDLEVFTAPYGDSTSGARARLRCRKEGMRLEQSDKQPHVCLGVVVGWTPEEAVLDVQPLALFS